MAKKAKKAKKRKGGRPTKYNPKYVKVAGKLCEEKGYTNKNLAAHFKVAESTINKWKKEFSEFSDAIKKGKDEFDSQVVEQSLLKRALGYSYVETTRELQADNEEVPDDDDGESAIQTLVVTKKVTKQVVPSDVAIIFWLKNRRPGRWSDVKEIEHRIEEIGKPLTIDEMKKRILEAGTVGTGIDNRSIEGSNGNNAS